MTTVVKTILFSRPLARKIRRGTCCISGCTLIIISGWYFMSPFSTSLNKYSINGRWLNSTLSEPIMRNWEASSRFQLETNYLRSNTAYSENKHKNYRLFQEEEMKLRKLSRISCLIINRSRVMYVVNHPRSQYVS